MKRAFVDMYTVLPEADIGDYRISHYEVTADGLQKWREYWTRTGNAAALKLAEPLQPGTYARLTSSYTGWMDDTHYERQTNEAFLHAAFGDVLICGLGLGMLPAALLRDPTIRSVTVLEIQTEIIDLVYRHIKDPRLTVLQADATRPPLHGRRFDSIYLDIWPDINGKNWPQMKTLLRLYRGLCRPAGIVQAWLKDEVQRAYRK